MSQSRGVEYYFNTQTGESQWEPPSNQREEVRASHILVKHAGSRRPSSWKEQNITRSLDEAKQILRSWNY